MSISLCKEWFYGMATQVREDENIIAELGELKEDWFEYLNETAKSDAFNVDNFGAIRSAGTSTNEASISINGDQRNSCASKFQKDTYIEEDICEEESQSISLTQAYMSHIAKEKETLSTKKSFHGPKCSTPLRPDNEGISSYDFNPFSLMEKQPERISASNFIRPETQKHSTPISHRFVAKSKADIPCWAGQTFYDTTPNRLLPKGSSSSFVHNYPSSKGEILPRKSARSVLHMQPNTTNMEFNPWTKPNTSNQRLSVTDTHFVLPLKPDTCPRPNRRNLKRRSTGGLDGSLFNDDFHSVTASSAISNQQSDVGYFSIGDKSENQVLSDTQLEIESLKNLPLDFDQSPILPTRREMSILQQTPKACTEQKRTVSKQLFHEAASPTRDGSVSDSLFSPTKNTFESESVDLNNSEEIFDNLSDDLCSELCSTFRIDSQVMGGETSKPPQKNQLYPGKNITVEYDSMKMDWEEMKVDLFLQGNTPLKSSGICNMGFQTASKKPIKISEESMKKAGSLLAEINAGDCDVSIQPEPVKKNIFKPPKNVKSKSKKSTVHSTRNEEYVSVGFQTASMKPLKVSDEAMKKVKSMFESELFNSAELELNGQKPLESNLQMVGFTTASKKPLTVSKKSYEKAKSLMDSLNDEGSNSDKPPGNVCSDKIETRNSCMTQIKDSDFDDIDDDMCSELCSTFRIDSQVLGGQSSDVKLTQNDNLLFDDLVITDVNNPIKVDWNNKEDQSPGVVCNVGFQTASKKPIKISEESMKKAGSLLAEINSDGSDVPIQPEPVKKNIFKPPKSIKSKNKKSTVNTRKEEYVSVGFQTASMKPLKVSDEAMKKVKSMFESELLNTDELELNDQKPLESNLQMVGFTTASKKPLTVSKKSFEKAKSLMDFLNDEGSNSDKPSGNVCNDKIETGNSCTTQIKDSDFDDIDDDLCSELCSTFRIDSQVLGGQSSDVKLTQNDNLLFETYECHPIKIDCHKTEPEGGVVCNMGFQTASKKPIKISEESMKKAGSLLAEINSDCCDVPIQPEPVKKNVFKPPKSIKNKNKKSTVNTGKEEYVSVGFQTASMKPLKVSDKAMKKVKSMFESELLNTDELELNDQKPLESNLQMVGFTTASKKPLSVSKKSYEKAKSLMNSLNDEDSNSDKPPGNVCSDKIETRNSCTTQIKDSDFDDIDDDLCSELCSTFRIDSQVLGGQSSDVKPTQNDQLNSDVMEYSSTTIDSGTQWANINVGFQTASKKPIKISEESMKKAGSLLAEINAVDCDVPIQPEPVKKNVFKPPKNVKVDRKQRAVTNKKKEQVAVGFQTASKKPVEVSCKSIKKAEPISRKADGDGAFSGLVKSDAIPTDQKTRTKNLKISGFQTASMKPLKVSDEAMKKVKSMFESELLNTDEWKLNEHKPLESNLQMVGFTTASKKPLTVSKKSFEKARSLMNSLNDEDSNSDKPSGNVCSDKTSLVVNNGAASNDFTVGFTTASKTSLNVSLMSLEKTKPLFVDDVSSPNTSKAECSVTHENLSESSHVSETAEFASSSKLLGFSETSMKPAKTAKERVKKSKALFGRLHDFDDCSSFSSSFQSSQKSKNMVKTDSKVEHQQSNSSSKQPPDNLSKPAQMRPQNKQFIPHKPMKIHPSQSTNSQFVSGFETASSKFPAGNERTRTLSFKTAPASSKSLEVKKRGVKRRSVVGGGSYKPPRRKIVATPANNVASSSGLSKKQLGLKRELSCQIRIANESLLAVTSVFEGIS